MNYLVLKTLGGWTLVHGRAGLDKQLASLPVDCKFVNYIPPYASKLNNGNVYAILPIAPRECESGCIAPRLQEQEIVTKIRKWVLPDDEPAKPAEKQWRRATIKDCDKMVVPFGTPLTSQPVGDSYKNHFTARLLGVNDRSEYVLDRAYGSSSVVPEAWILE